MISLRIEAETADEIDHVFVAGLGIVLSLPVEVLDSLKLDFDWMTTTLPARDSFINVAPSLVHT